MAFSFGALASVTALLVGAGFITVQAGPELGLHARVEGQDHQGEWKTVAEPRAFGEAGAIYSAGRLARLVVENDRVVPAIVIVEISYYRDGVRQVFGDEWTLAPLETRTHSFTMPEEAYRDGGAVVAEGVLVYVNVGDLRMSLNMDRQ